MKEFFVPLAIIAVLSSLLLPIPAELLDFLIAGNLGLSLLLLVSSLYVTDSLKLSALPTLLLISTLYRLSLNVASTRLILGNGEAGQVIEAFGSVVISGNIVVGTVIFLVITLIQFLVIAKGSERVAEVAARFTLDALPGKQMSIDADVRAGLIDFETARRRRQEIQTESRFYGALDGAMKFVKGDAIAGIIIAAINIIGGLSIGILLQDKDLSEAISKYSLLTIGDGLVSQIPALLSALAAGIIVTRVARGDGATISQELYSQLGQIRAAKFIIAGFCIAIMFVPGMPLMPFACMALALALSAILMKENRGAVGVLDSRFEPRRVPLLEIVIAEDIANNFSELPEIKFFINQARTEVYEKSGLLLLPPEISITKQLNNCFEIRIRGSKAYRQSLSLEMESYKNEIMSAFILTVLNRKSELLDDIMSRRLLDLLDKDHPELVSSVVPGAITITQFTEILKALIRESISIRQVEIILQGIAESNFKAEGTRLLLEDVRCAMGRVIVDYYLDNNSKLQCYFLDAALDSSLVRVERSESTLPIDAISKLVKEIHQINMQGVVIVVSKGARALLKDCLHLRRLSVPVLAHEEIPEDVVVENIGILGECAYEDAEDLVSSLAA